MRYVFHGLVDKVEHRKHIGRVIKDANGDAFEENVTYSWVVVSNRIAFDFGAEQPELQEGDTLRWTLEKV